MLVVQAVARASEEVNEQWGKRTVRNMRGAGSEQVQAASRSPLFLMLAGKGYNTHGQGLSAPGSLGEPGGSGGGRAWKRRLLGRDPGQALGKHLLQVLSPCSPATFTRVFVGRLKSSIGFAV